MITDKQKRLNQLNDSIVFLGINNRICSNNDINELLIEDINNSLEQILASNNTSDVIEVFKKKPSLNTSITLELELLAANAGIL